MFFLYCFILYYIIIFLKFRLGSDYSLILSALGDFYQRSVHFRSSFFDLRTLSLCIYDTLLQLEKNKSSLLSYYSNLQKKLDWKCTKELEIQWLGGSIDITFSPYTLVAYLNNLYILILNLYKIIFSLYETLNAFRV